MKRLTNAKAAEAISLNQECSTHTGSLYAKRAVDGSLIAYSYGDHFPLALVDVDEKAGSRDVWLNDDKYSSTTSRHQRLVERALIFQGFSIHLVDTKRLKHMVNGIGYAYLPGTGVGAQ